MSAEILNRIIEYISRFLALILVLSLHEFAHAFAAVKSGDNTPKIYNRYTLNPLAHFDAVGLISFIVLRFGWSKPVPVNPNNFRKYKTGCFWVSISGVLTNLLTSFLIIPLYYLSQRLPSFGYFTFVLQEALYYTIIFGITFFLFNLLPFYPLDGFRLYDVFSKKQSKLYYYLRNYGAYVIYVFFLLSIVSRLTGIAEINVLGLYINNVGNYILLPMTKFWGLIF